MIGMANKAYKVVSGETAVRNSIRRNKTKLLIIAKDAASNTKKRFENSAYYYNVPYFNVFSKSEISIGIAGKYCSVIGIEDENFALQIQELLKNTL